MNAPTLQHRYMKDVWVPRFASRLRELRPLRGTAALEIADTEYYLFPDVEPEEAARTYADETPASVGKWF